MKKVLPALAATLLLGGALITPALAVQDDAKTMETTDAQDTAAITMVDVPADATTIATYYNEGVYDPKDNKIGDVSDLLLDEKGQIQAVIVGVGGFLGVGAKDVAVPFDALKVTEKDGDTYLVMNATKEALEKATGYVYNDETRTWVPAKKPG